MKVLAWLVMLMGIAVAAIEEPGFAILAAGYFGLLFFGIAILFSRRL